MQTAVDSSILIDILKKEPKFWQSSFKALQEVRQKGALLACPIVWSEVSCFFKEPKKARPFFMEAGILFDPFDQDCAELAGKFWRTYREQGGKRQHLIADFLIASHAQCRGGRLLTRDRGFYRRYFKALEIIEP